MLSFATIIYYQKQKNEWEWSTGRNTCRGKVTYSEKNCPSVTLFTTNSTLSGLGLNLGLHSNRQVTCWAMARHTCSSGFSVSADVHRGTYSALETLCTPLNIISAEENRRMFRSEHKNSGKRHNIKMANKSLQNVAQFEYFGMALNNQNCIHEEMKMNSDSACYHLVQYLLLSHLLI